MRVISNKVLVEFAASDKQADTALQSWRRAIETRSFANFADLKATFNTIDKVGNVYVFDIAGNKLRLIAAIHFNRQMLFIRQVLTHKEYDQWKP